VRQEGDERGDPYDVVVGSRLMNAVTTALIWINVAVYLANSPPEAHHGTGKLDRRSRRAVASAFYSTGTHRRVAHVLVASARHARSGIQRAVSTPRDNMYYFASTSPSRSSAPGIVRPAFLLLYVGSGIACVRGRARADPTASPLRVGRGSLLRRMPSRLSCRLETPRRTNIRAARSRAGSC